MKLILGPAGTGKTDYCLNALRTESGSRCMVLPDGASVDRLKKRLIRMKKPLPSETRLMDWGSWLSGLIRLEKKGYDAARATALCARICERALDENSFFGKARFLTSFHQMLVQRFEEWEMRGLTPDELLEAARALPDQAQGTACGLDSTDCRAEWLQRIDEMVKLWQQYRVRAARAGLMNMAQIHEIAIQKLRSHEPLTFDWLLLDGFQSLPEVSLRLLDAFRERSIQLLVTLTCDLSRPDLFVPTIQLKEQLEARFQPEIVLMEQPKRFFNPTLSQLEARLWQDKSSRDEPPDDDISLEPVKLIDAPTMLAEVETVARQIGRLYAKGIPYEDMAILARSPESYALLLPILFERYEIPLQMEVRSRLVDSPAIRALLNYIDLVIESPHPEPLFEWLRLPLVQFPREHWSVLKQSARKLREPSDWLAWTEEIKAQGYSPEADFLQAWLQMRLARHEFFSEERRAELEAHCQTLFQQLIPSQQMKLRDQSAVQTAKSLLSAYVEQMPDRSLQGHLLNLKQLWMSSSFSYTTGDKGVPVIRTEETDLGEARIAFVIGALEGTFPRRHPDDPFLREEERAALTSYWQGRFDLTTETEKWESERFRFYRAATAAREKLFFSYPRSSGESDALPSFYLQDVERALPNGGIEHRFYPLERIQPDPSEAIHAYDEGLLNPFYDWTFAHTDLRHSRAKQWASQINRVFSVTELETLMKCPFHHLARYRMKAWAPRGKLHITEIGTLLHDTLRRAFASQKLPAEPVALAEHLQTIVDVLLEEQQEEFAPWQILVIREFCARLLRAFAERESRYLKKFGLTPTYFEWSFGQGAADEEEQGQRARDPRSRPEPFTLGNGKTLRVCGVIDRVDLNPQGDLAMLIDYKTGSPVTLKAMEEGDSIQMPVYAMAFQDTFKEVRLSLAYDTLSGNRRYRILPYSKTSDPNLIPLMADKWEGTAKEVQDVMPPNKWIAIQRQVSDQIARIVQEMENAEVAPRPGTHCQQCAYGDFCRSAQLS